jgi:biopolymer transport protein ExbD
MKLPSSLRLGIFLLLVSITFYVVPVTWIKTRNFDPLDVPLILFNGHFRSLDFKIDLSASYIVGFYNPAEPVPPYTFCGDKTAEIAKWKVFNNGRDVPVNHEARSGLPSADEFTGQHSDTFNGGRGIYSIDVELDSVPDCLRQAKVHLLITTSQEKYWKHYLDLCGICLVLGGTGFAMLIQGAWFSIQGRSEIPRDQHSPISQSPGYTRNFGVRKRLPMPLFHHLPDFGLMHIATMLSVLIVFLFSWMSEAYPVGTNVLIVTPREISAANHSRTEPLRVWLNTSGEFLVSEKSVPRDKLQDAVRYELAHRAEEIVYFGADGNPDFAEAVFAINEINLAGGKVVWVTPKTVSEIAIPKSAH